MNQEGITRDSSWSDPRGQVMKTPDDVAEMLRLRTCVWAIVMWFAVTPPVLHSVPAMPVKPIASAPNQYPNRLNASRSGSNEADHKAANLRHLMAPTMGEEANTREVQKRHRPGGRLSDSGVDYHVLQLGEKYTLLNRKRSAEAPWIVCAES